MPPLHPQVECLESRTLFSAIPPDVAGNTLLDAMDLGAVTRAQPAIVDGLVSGNDRRDVFRFTVGKAGKLTVHLDALDGNANLVLFDADGKRIGVSSRDGRRAETITRRLDAGSYAIRVSAAADDDAPIEYTLKTFRGGPDAEPPRLPISASAIVAPTGYDIFVKIDGIKGESLDDRHRDEIEALGFTFNVARTKKGRAKFTDLTFTKFLDSATPRLLVNAASGRSVGEVVITLVKSGGDDRLDFMTYTLGGVTITSLTARTDDDPLLPTDVVALKFETVELEYTPVDNTGKQQPSVTGGWDLITNKRV